MCLLWFLSISTHHSLFKTKNPVAFNEWWILNNEKFLGVGSGNLTELQSVINAQAAKGYRLHTISTTSSGSKSAFGGDRIQATMVFEKI